MPISSAVADRLTRYFPKVISPKSHAVLDLFTMTAFFVSSGLFWNRNRRAALGALACGGAQLMTGLLTDFSGNGSNPISLPIHGKIDLGLAAVSAAMPELMLLKERPQRTFFVSQSAIITSVANLTDFQRTTGKRLKSRPRRAAA